MIILDPIDVSAAVVFVSSNVPENDAPAQSLTRVYAAKDVVMDPAAHRLFESRMGARGTISIATGAPGIITWPAHGQVAGTPLSFESTGALPPEMSPNVVYFVVAPALNTFQVSATVGGSPITMTGTVSGVHNATAGQNFNRPLTDKTYWLPLGATNRWKMIDQYNNTQTENPEEIVITVRPQAIVQAIYVGNVDVDEIEITGNDLTDGLVFSETSSMVISNSGSSLFNWIFKRPRRRRQFCTLQLPMYYAADFEVRLKKPGGIAKCGMFCIGPLEDVGLSEYGLAAEIKDYSSTRFDFDGTSETTLRGYSKKMNVDIEVRNDVVDEVHDRLIDFRQKTIVLIGAKQFDLSLLCGVIASFKTVVASKPKSKIAMQVEGKV